jgi:tetratricopeptide (TPR) repeat protein
MGSFSDLRVGGRRRRICAAVLCALVLCVASGEIARAAPFVPSDAEQILERLPPRTGAEWDAIRALRVALDASPDSALLAAQLARAYLDLFRVEGDPRLVAYAQTALSAWASDATPPVEIALQRALVAQTEHRFEAAAIDLERVTARAPRDPQAWLTLAALALARGDFAASRQACSRVLLLADPWVAGACFAAWQAMTGQAEHAYDFLSGALTRPDAELDDGVASWIALLAAETSASLGRDDEADAHYRKALALFERAGTRPSIYSLAAYADFLLECDQPAAVLELLRNVPSADPILLRLTRAKRRRGEPVEAELETLRYRLQLSLTGADDTHAREAAYLAVYLLDEPQQALSIALRNWAVQREPIDARLVLEAALAAGAPTVAQPVIDWLQASSVQHIALERLQARLGEAP